LTFSARPARGPRRARPRTSYRLVVRPRARPPSVCETSGGGPGAPSSDRVEFIRGADCRDVLPNLPGAVFDACITDPPYGLGMFEWDRAVPGPDVWREVLRVLKPGAALVAFGARRTYHRLATAVEDAGFRIVDQAIWVYLTGRPPTRNHLRPAHELILLARSPGPALPVDIDAARIPWRDAEDRERVQRIDSLRAGGRRRGVYDRSLDKHGRAPFATNDGGRWPSTVMATGDDTLGEASHVFLVPKVRNIIGHPCSKPIEMLSHLVNLFVPPGGVVLDPFAGSGPVATAVEAANRKAVLIDGLAVT
jgi:DNA modification methylase